MSARYLIATDGTASAEGALRMGLELHRKGRAVVEILTVVEPSPPVAMPGMEAVAAAYAPLDQALVSSRKAAVAAQLAALGDEAAAWPVIVELGTPAAVIARVAKERGATMIVVGSRPHGLLQRLMRSETALGVIHVSEVPVLAVPADRTELPNRVLVGVDFSDATDDAIHAVLPLLGKSPTIHLAHVSWESALREPEEYYEWKQTYLYGAAARLEEMAAELWADTQVHVETHVTTGSPEKKLEDLAHQLGVDLVASGTHGYGPVRRALVGSVSTALIRHSSCSVLLTPTHLRSGRRAGAVPTPDVPELPPLQPIF